MKLALQIKKIYQDLPSNLKRFLIRGAILFAVWELLYNFVLIPIDIPDHQLTQLIVYGTSWLLSLFYTNITVSGANIFIDGKDAIFVASSCNGLELLVLYIGFMLCLPTSAKRFWAFTLIGFIVICFLNMLRCVALAVLFLNHHPLADFAHHFAFKLIMYGVIFYGWILYSKKLKMDDGV